MTDAKGRNDYSLTKLLSIALVVVAEKEGTMWFFKFIDLVELLAKLYHEREFTAIYCAGGKIWVKKLGFAKACPAEGIYVAPADWQERVRPLGQYPAWMVGLLAYWISNGKSLVYQPIRNEPGGWSLDVVR